MHPPATGVPPSQVVHCVRTCSLAASPPAGWAQWPAAHLPNPPPQLAGQTAQCLLWRQAKARRWPRRHVCVRWQLRWEWSRLALKGCCRGSARARAQTPGEGLAGWWEPLASPARLLHCRRACRQEPLARSLRHACLAPQQPPAACGGGGADRGRMQGSQLRKTKRKRAVLQGRRASQRGKHSTQPVCAAASQPTCHSGGCPRCCSGDGGRV